MIIYITIYNAGSLRYVVLFALACSVKSVHACLWLEGTRKELVYPLYIYIYGKGIGISLIY